MQTLLLIVHVLLAVALIGLVLIQHGKGADAGAAFGSGASATVFGARGAGNVLSRATAIVAAIFFVTSLSLAYFSGQNIERRSVAESVVPQTSPVQTVPAQDVEKQEAPASDVPAPPVQPAK